MTKTHDTGPDAVRYAVLRKLASGMRHSLMGELQAIQLSGDVAAQMIKAGATGAKLSEAVNQIPERAKAAARTSRSIMEWLRPEGESSTAIEAALQECVRLAGDDWTLRGIVATINCQPGCTAVAKAAFFELVATSLLALTDMQPGPLDIDVIAEQVNGKVVVNLSAHAASRRSPLPPLTLYRALNFDDVTALAKAHEVPCLCNDATVTLEFRPATTI